MPAINTRGAMSARGFGFAAPQGSAGYKYLMLYSTGTYIYYSNTTVAAIVVGSTPYINTGTAYWQGGSPYTPNGVATSGSTIVASTAVSSNNGATWTSFLPVGSWNNYYTSNIYTAGGRNGNIALDPTTKVACGAWAYYNSKTAQNYTVIVTYPGTSYSAVSGVNPYYTCVTFWPLANRFYAPVFQSSTVTSLPTSGSGSSFSAAITMGGQPWCYAADGSLYWVTNGSNVYNTTDTSLSSAGTYVGTDYWASYITQSVPVQAGGSWYKVIRYSTVYYFLVSSSVHPTFSSSVLSTIPNTISGAQAAGRVSLFYEADTGRFWVNALWLVSGPKGAYYIWTTNWSTDGVSWTTVSNFQGAMCFTKNTSYA